MGASESTFSTAQRPNDEITTVSERTEVVDPILQRLKSLKIATPILTSEPAESSLSDILVRKSSSSSNSSTINPNVLLELFSMYRDWQERKARDISVRQEDIENKIEVADALAVKLLQRYNVSVSAMKTTSQNLSEVDALQVELGELKGRLTEVISNCDALCKRITTEGPESLRSSIKPFSSSPPDLSTSSTLPSAPDESQLSASSTTDIATPHTLPSSETNTNEENS
ncbi:OLC1v1011010C1 [Oldenlandia corymbosa var. corymbosa]|uniref:OLC1v1011010C1 n=1 Tax=Oldenlandia corymbosa var. corymbosa TaxID=529605 RepID=A0AAV1DVP8_OLDCO|nr:OLC1v1011010C1 [Oldenlandia corymbosa var. corymbosa]